MASFGRFHPDQELHRTGLGAVFKARAADTEGYVLKILDPPPDVLRPEAVEAIGSRFLEQAQLQQKVAAGSGDRRHWAPIYDCGIACSKAFYVTDYFPLSVQDLIDGRAHTTWAVLHAIVTAVVTGLHQLDTACHRSHGNLKPSNVLIRVDRAADITVRDVFLTDPHVAVPLSSDTVLSDQHQLGRLIYGLVTHRAPPDSDQWSAGRLPHWRDGGRTSNRWYELCRDLLDPEADKDPMSLGVLAERIAALRPGVRSRWIVVSVLMIGWVTAAFAVYVVWQDKPPPSVIDPQARVTLDHKYKNWFGYLAKDFHSLRRQPYQSDHWLRPIVAVFDQAERNGDVFDPNAIAPNGQSQREIEVALDRIEKIEKILRALGDAEKPWPQWEMVRSTIQRYHEQRWDRPARVLRRLLERLSAADLIEVINGIDEVIELAPLLAQIDRDWTALQMLAQQIVDAGDPLLVEYHVYIAGQLQQEMTLWDVVQVLSRLSDRLSQQLKLAGRVHWSVDRYWYQTVDQQNFLDHRTVKRTPDQVLTSAIIEQWLQEVKDPRFRQLDVALDPRGRWVLSPVGTHRRQPAEMPAVRRLVEQLTTEVGVGGKSQINSILTQLRVIESGIVSVDRKPWNALRRQEIEQQVAVLDDQIRRLRADLGRVRSQLAQSYEQYTARLRQRHSVVGSASQALDAVWRQQRDRLLVQAGVDQRLRPALSERIGQLEALLKRFDSAFGQQPNVPWREWAKPMIRHWMSIRERAIQTALQHIDWDEVFTPNGQGKIIPDAKAYTQHLTAVTGLFGDFYRLEDLLDTGHDLHEHPIEGPSVGQLLDRWRPSKWWSDDPTMTQVLEPLIKRIQRLEDVHRQHDPVKLVGMVQDVIVEDLAGAMAAWRRLGQMNRWPARWQDLDSEVGLQRRLRAAVMRVPDRRRQARLTQELVEEAKRRWLTCFSQVIDPTDIDRCVAYRAELGVDRQTLVGHPRLRFNLLLHALNHLPTDLPKSQQRRLITDHLQTLQSLIPRLDSEVQGSVGLFADRLRQLLDESGTAADIDPEKLGPATVDGWTGRVAESDGRYVEFLQQSPRGTGHKLVFFRVDLEQDTSVYVSTTEVSVGLFRDVVSASGMWSQVAPRMGEENFELLVPGPRSWQWVDANNPEKGIDVAMRWYAVPPTNLDQMGSVFAKELRLERQDSISDLMRIRPADQPSLVHPVQHVSASGAWWFAHMMGCRLPTVSEWHAARRVNHQQRTNLRDQTWRRQQQHIQQMIGRGGTNYPWPDVGIFVPDVGLGLDLPDQQDATAWDTNDQRLWFDAVDDGQAQPFHHLEGNVAEFVYNHPDRFAQAAAGDGPERFDQLPDPGLAVIGGSALSAPELAVDRPYPLDLSDYHRGFSDVGFRLVFVLPKPTVTMMLEQLLKEFAYITLEDN